MPPEFKPKPEDMVRTVNSLEQKGAIKPEFANYLRTTVIPEAAKKGYDLSSLNNSLNSLEKMATNISSDDTVRRAINTQAADGVGKELFREVLTVGMKPEDKKRFDNFVDKEDPTAIDRMYKICKTNGFRQENVAMAREISINISKGLKKSDGELAGGTKEKTPTYQEWRQAKINTEMADRPHGEKPDFTGLFPYSDYAAEMRADGKKPIPEKG